MRIRDHLQWQDDTNLDAFITRLTDSEERVRQNVRQYVVGETVRDRLDSMFKAVGERLDERLPHRPERRHGRNARRRFGRCRWGRPVGAGGCRAAQCAR